MFRRRIFKYLEKWKDRPDRKPLVIKGARQVGKTVSVQLFAKKHFKEMIYLNLEKVEQKKLFSEPLSLEDFNKIIQLKFGKTLKEGETLLFIDEIQNCPSLISLLRFFYEEIPRQHVITAGSLLEVKLLKEGFSFPVGRVEFAYLYPLDFFEYLEAKGENALLDELKKMAPSGKTIPAFVEAAEKNFNEYVMIGGMPEAVANYLSRQDFTELNRIYEALFTAYIEDIHKYASEAKKKYLIHCLENAPLFSGQCITYEHFGGSIYRSREIVSAFDILEKVMLVNRIRASKDTEPPLTEKRKKAPKLIFLDTGLMIYKMGIRDKLLEVKDLNDFARGRVAEQIVAQSLIAQEETSLPQIFYWYRDFPGSTAEVDYLFQLAGEIIPLEVKSGKSGKMLSLKEFVKMSGRRRTFRIYNGPLKEEILKFEDLEFSLLSIPFYLLPRIKELSNG